MNTKRVKIPREVNNYIEALFMKDNYLRCILFLLLADNNSLEEDVEYYFNKTIISSMALALAKEDISKTYKPSSEYTKFYMDFENQEIVFCQDNGGNK